MPRLHGRGVEARMPVILPGVPDGMVSAGIIGLFVGAVALAAGHQGCLSSFSVFADDRCAEVE